MKTFLPKVDAIQRNWFVIDATGKPLGRLAVEVANRLRGRHKAIYTPHLDTGDHIIVINADKVLLTGNKEETKEYDSYSGYMGGRKVIKAKELRAKDASRMITTAVWGMMPHNRLGRQMFTKLRVYNGAEHGHQAQNPQPLSI